MSKNQLAYLAALITTTLATYLFSISPLTYLTPQLTALLAIILLVRLFFKKTLSLILSSTIITLLVFTTNGLSSPAFFLVYFLLFTLAFQNPPSLTLAYSLSLIIFLSQSLNSLASLLPLISLLLITPLAWFVGRQFLQNRLLTLSLSNDETDVFLWFSLKFKTAVISILDSCSQLLSNPRLTHLDRQHLESIQSKTKILQKSARQLTSQVDKQTDENL